MASLLESDLRAITGLAEADLDPLWTLDNVDQLTSAMYDILPALVDQWALAAGAVAADWYDLERQLEDVPGVFQAIVPPLEDLGTEALIGWATEPLRRDEPDPAIAKYRAVSGVQKRLANTANHTITTSAVADPQARGWIRVANADACDFCKMIAGRDVVYTTSVARFASHEDCYCRAQPAWGGESQRVRKYTQSFRRAQMTEKQRKDMDAAARAWIKANLT